MLYWLDGEERMKYCDFLKKVRKQLNAFSEYPPSLQNAFSDIHTLSEIRYRPSSYISYF